MSILTKIILKQSHSKNFCTGTSCKDPGPDLEYDAVMECNLSGCWVERRNSYFTHRRKINKLKSEGRLS